MSFRRIPKEIDPRRPPKRRERKDDGQERSEPRSYGQYLEIAPDELEELERVTGEVAREGAPESGDGEEVERKQQRHKVIEEREEFEDMTGEVSREDGEPSR